MNLFLHYWFLSSNNHRRGFTLIEMMVVVGIFLVLTGAALANLPRFRSKASLDLVAQDVAITIRQAQVYGVSNRQFAPDQFPAYGVYFEQNTPISFILFADANSDNNYNSINKCGNSGTECVERYNLEGGIAIAKICGYVASAPTELTSLNVVFRRPQLEPIFKGDPNNSYGAIKLILYSVRDQLYKAISVSQTGFIGVSDWPAGNKCATS